jgi:hypothetical protein
MLYIFCAIVCHTKYVYVNFVFRHEKYCYVNIVYMHYKYCCVNIVSEHEILLLSECCHRAGNIIIV